MYATRVSRVTTAPVDAVYDALTRGDLVARWRVPDGMTSEVHEFDAREGGRFRVSLTYETPGERGKTSARTDTYHGRFERLMPGELVVEVLEFEAEDPALRGEMRMTTTITSEPGLTKIEMLHEGVPDAIPPDQNEAGMRMALDRLAELVEADS